MDYLLPPRLFPNRFQAKRYLIRYLFTIYPRPPRLFRLLFSILTTLRKERWGIIERGFNIKVIKGDSPWA